MQAASNLTPYEAIGGEAGIQQLVHRFYALMDELPEAYTVRKMHPESLAGSAESLFEFLSGWLGGPPLYANKKGHPRLRMRHAPYAVDQVVRNEWMQCMTQAIEEQVSDPPFRTWLLASFAQMASHMINTESAPPCHFGMPASA
ncbi:group II truncated hemoglobin [Rhodoferax antarcticus]|uniref:Putative globin family protein n=1 Tax=Rhodoferax antarcticus ANT.BR TaxID=1111071 RepID=A0A1Q8YBV4_9BURK|nr:group II truncated hemoglobin [Rhodoferax antarcticus]APW46601.1 globin [Rhodoferax antarcticus]MCW2313208.1 hemoglobin [Rhodoferax antarcticus]OLP05472.1 putative globin family protein [Rhodoferax antarcticus ANT.BR]